VSDEIPEYMTVAEVALVFKRNQDTIRRKIKRGLFAEVVRVDDGYLIPKASVLKVLEQGEAAALEEDAEDAQTHARRKMISKGLE